MGLHKSPPADALLQVYHGPKRNAKPEELLNADVVRTHYAVSADSVYPLRGLLCAVNMQ